MALQKPNGRVRGIVVGDILRRLVARCLAQIYAPHIQRACSPHQYALATRAGAEAVVHAITAATERDTTNTVLSIDGIGAYDTISRGAMLNALQEVPEANRCSPFVHMFYSQPSTYVWHDNAGRPHTITQAEGGEQGDPLMPALFSLGQKAALQAVQQHLQPGEYLFAFLDDIYTIVPPARVRPVYDLLAHHLFSSAHIQLNSGKTRVWNMARTLPPNLDGLGGGVWVGDRGLPAEAQGLMVLGAPVGTPQYKQQHLQQLRAQHDQLLQRIPELDDLQASWLLLLFCASPRCNYQLRMLSPHDTAHFAAAHDVAVAACFTRLLDTAPLPAPALGTAHLPLHMGGLGLTSAVATACPAYWASWADVLPVLQAQAPQQAAAIHRMLSNPTEATTSIQAATHCAEQLRQLGWEPPDWSQLIDRQAVPDPPPQAPESPTIGGGWQQAAARACHNTHRAAVLQALDSPSQALLESQAGPHASRPFTTIPYNPNSTYPSPIFRVLLLRRLRLPLPLSARYCRCRRALDFLGDHRAACPQSGVLRSRGGHSNGQPPASAERPGHESPPTPEWQT